LEKDEITKILREALEKKKDAALGSMTHKDQRLISIATRPSDEQVQARLRAVRCQAMLWPYCQAMLSCTSLFVVFVLGAAFSLSGHNTPQSIGYSSLVFFALLGVSLTQMIWLGFSPKRSSATRAQ